MKSIKNYSSKRKFRKTIEIPMARLWEETEMESESKDNIQLIYKE